MVVTFGQGVGLASVSPAVASTSDQAGVLPVLPRLKQVAPIAPVAAAAEDPVTAGHQLLG